MITWAEVREAITESFVIASIAEGVAIILFIACIGVLALLLTHELPSDVPSDSILHRWPVAPIGRTVAV